ncbi:hypothetical protein QX204_31455 [Nocardia sp. PE-7]|uniref:hypothetical protein n=1 Tax=Nocardia sp. PE-7 TaxID=3058426 RepID=UPI002658B185|nr:hypothetical protein [Nocardia sp. PE-7]WKG09475.1 hypothetical protein QX204_31455 [Nocardia sp. PE-7]
MTVVHLRHAEPGLLVIAADGAPLVTDAAPGLDVLVLEVLGGHLSWRVFDSDVVPAAVLDDVEAAQEWVWAVYGEEVALAVADNRPRSVTAAPARRESTAALRRLAYAHWASRWWPASTVDGIPALDHRLLLEEIELLTATCEMVIDEDVGEVAHELGAARPSDDGAASITGRAEDYALAAGGADSPEGLIVARGSGGWDWRLCPPGILDAGEQAVSWQVSRAAGVSTVRVSVVAAPDCRQLVPDHLRPYARVRAELPSVDVEVPLHLRGDAWTGSATLPGTPEKSPEITVFVPGVGPVDQPEDESAVRDRIRRFVRARLTEPTGDQRLAAETAAAETDEDF